MNISKKWLSQYMDVSDISMEEIAKRITDAGLEVEGISYMSQGTNLVIGQVLTCVDHPDSDHLHICEVDVQTETLQIVCGASNVAAGQKVIVAKVGAKLPEIEIKAGTIRGCESNGMICSLLELGVDSQLLNEVSKNGIEVLPSDAPIGHCDPLGYLGYDDVILDVGLTPNRNDCMAAWSMALEVGAVLNKKVTLPSTTYEVEELKPTLQVHSETEKCPFFLGKMIHKVTVKESVKWMKDLLQASGIKSINNIVDISNIVMLETGQPLHFYDMKAIPSKSIVVKDNVEANYTALDDTTYELQQGDLVITSQDQPIGIAGIMGGNDSKIQDTTTGMIIEVACFDHVSIRNTSRRLNLSTDASVRYQKGIEPLAAKKAMQRAVQLLIEYADAQMIEETVQYGKEPYTPISLSVSLQRINHLLGTQFTLESVVDVLNRLHLQPKVGNDEILVTIPSYRMDLKIEADIAEEIIRILGFDSLPATLPFMPTTLGSLDKRQRLRRKYRSLLTGLGYYEAITYSLVSKEKLDAASMPLEEYVELASPMSEDRRYVRMGIMPSLLDSLAYNQARSIKDVALFELSNVYGKGKVEEHLCVVASGSLQKGRWQKFSLDADFYVMKGLVESLLEAVGFDGQRVFFKENQLDTQNFHPYRSAQIYLGKQLLGIIGEIHPAVCKKLNIQPTVAMELNLEIILSNKTSKVKFTEISKYPSVNRDLAFVVKEDVSAASIVAAIKKNGKLGKENVIRNVEVFDVYTGKHVEQGCKSIALSVTFQSDDRTLKDEEINTIFTKIIDTLQTELQATLRG